MKKIIIRENTLISPFYEPARDLRIMNKPLWLYQRDVLSAYCREEVECSSFESITTFPPEILSGEVVVYRDNLYFDEFLFNDFITAARKLDTPAQIAFSQDDIAIVTHALPLQEGIRLEDDVYVADLYFFPDGATIGKIKPTPVVIDTMPREIGYYRVPTYMANQQGELGYMVPLRALLSIENWVHIFIANVPFGMFAHGARIESSLDNFSMMLKVLWRSFAGAQTVSFFICISGSWQEYTN